MDWVTTSTILHDLRDFRNESAWQRFVSRFHDPIARFARRCGVSERMSEDVAQETLLAFANAYRAGSYDPARGRLSSWLFGIAFRQARQQTRKDARGEQLAPAGTAGDDFWANLPDEEAATSIWELEWQEFLLRECLARARREFEAQTMDVFERLARGESPDDVAADTGLSIKTVYNTKHRVLRRIREMRPELEAL